MLLLMSIRFPPDFGGRRPETFISARFKSHTKLKAGSRYFDFAVLWPLPHSYSGIARIRTRI